MSYWIYSIYGLDFQCVVIIVSVAPTRAAGQNLAYFFNRKHQLLLTIAIEFTLNGKFLQSLNLAKWPEMALLKIWQVQKQKYDATMHTVWYYSMRLRSFRIRDIWTGKPCPWPSHFICNWNPTIGEQLDLKEGSQLLMPRMYMLCMWCMGPLLLAVLQKNKFQQPICFSCE